MIECAWDQDPNLRPTMDEMLGLLKVLDRFTPGFKTQFEDLLQSFSKVDSGIIPVDDIVKYLQENHDFNLEEAEDFVFLLGSVF